MDLDCTPFDYPTFKKLVITHFQLIGVDQPMGRFNLINHKPPKTGWMDVAGAFYLEDAMELLSHLTSMEGKLRPHGPDHTAQRYILTLHTSGPDEGGVVSYVERPEVNQSN